MTDTPSAYKGLTDPRLARDLTAAGALAQTVRTLAVIGARLGEMVVRANALEDRLTAFETFAETLNPPRRAYLRRKTAALRAVAAAALGHDLINADRQGRGE
ncbi:MAG: hypothetical protein ACFB2Z_03415 [Maricaulaceae bacterium]